MDNKIYAESEVVQRTQKIGDYVLLNKLGKGQFAEVWKGINEKNKKTYAIKQMRKYPIISNPLLERLLNTEVSIMNEITHPNILHLHDFLESENNYYLVMDYCNKGDFEQYLFKQPGRCLNEVEAVFYLKQIINGFQELYKRNILHRDFKLANLFLNDDIVVIGDFGFARCGNEMAQTKLGSPVTMAYEIMMADPHEEIKYDNKADLWSIGIVYYQILFGKPPFVGMTVPNLIRDIKNKVGKITFPKEISDESKDLINRLLIPDPQKRISWQEVFQHPLFEKFQIKSSSTLDSFLKKIGSLISNKIDEEFFQNKQKKNFSENFDFMHQNNLIKYKTKLTPKNISENPQLKKSKTVVTDEEVLNELDFRYRHEKNKILFLIYTVKKIQKYLKMGFFVKRKYEFYNISIFLIKKALTMNILNIKNLDNQMNYYNLNSEYFERLEKNTERRQKIIQIFKEDMNDLESYLNLLLERAKNEKIQIQHMYCLEQPIPDLFIVNNFILQWNLNLKDFLNTEEIREIDDIKKKVSFLIYSISLCIDLKDFNYITERNEKFNWKEFYERHENLSLANLNKLV
jgi:serine/threonine protein kinase